MTDEQRKEAERLIERLTLREQRRTGALPLHDQDVLAFLQGLLANE